MANKKNLSLIISALIILIVVGIGVYKSLYPDQVISWDEHDSKMHTLDKQLKKLADQIQSEVGPGKCATDDECKAAGLGARTCDGYKDFVVYSTRDTDEVTLLRLVKKFNDTARNLNELSLVAAKCGGEPLPIRCVNKQCAPVEAH